MEFKERECELSIIIPVLNEADCINQVTENIFNSSNVDFEIIVVDGSDSEDTIRAIKDTNVIKVASKKGRAHQMNRGAAIAKGEVLLFLHADTHLPKGALEEIISVLGNDRYVGGAFNLCIRSERIIFKIISRAITLRSRLTKVPYGDQAIFLRKDLFTRLGGYKEISLMEDLELMRRIRRSGDQIMIISECVSTSPRRWEREGILYCTVRNWTVKALYYFGVSPGRLVGFYKYDD